MFNIKYSIPKALIISRLLIGILLNILSSMHVAHYSMAAVILLAVGLLTDIFDGIYARKLGISTQALRRLDSSIDLVFFICVAIATYIQCRSFFELNAGRLAVLLGSEALTYIVSFAKFRKEIATHTIGAKAWTLVLFATLVQLMIQCESTVLFELCFWLGILTRLEIFAIILVLKKWTSDVPTVYHSILLRRNKEIKRHKLFNG